MTIDAAVARPGGPPALPFALCEYRERADRVRRVMAARGIDVLYVTSPANLCYLTGYEAIWYPNRLPVGLALPLYSPELLLCDWTRHHAYVSRRVLCDEIVLMDYGSAADCVAGTFAERGWSRYAVGIEWSSPNPAAPVMKELTERLVRDGATLVDGDWLVDQIRLYKSPAEIACVRKAAAVADAAMWQLQRDLRAGMSAAAVSAHLTNLLVRRGSEVAAMPALVNAGPTAWQDTHAFPSQRPLQAGDVVAVDCCAVIDRYHVNLGRTFSIGPPNARAVQLLALAADSVLELQRAARLGEGPEVGAAAAERFVRDRVRPEHIWWVGGYNLGIAFAPSWVGHAYLANQGLQACRWEAGFVSNFENIFIDPEDGFEASTIDTILMTDAGLEVLSSVPRGLLPASA